MIGRIAYILGALSPRERILVALLGLVVLPGSLLALVALPLVEAQDRAEAARNEAAAMLDWVVARDAEWAAQAPGAVPPRPAPAGITGVDAALTEAGLRGSADTLGNGRDGRVVLSLRGVEYLALAAFLDRAGAALGYEIAEMDVKAGDWPGLVSADLVLAPPEARK